MAKSTVSVIMPNYNDADYIAISLKAICEQSYPPFEVIVIDDGSTDNSIEVIQEMAAKYPVIRLLQNDTNRGIIYTVNRAGALATGDFLAMCSANDQILPGLFEKSVQLLEQYPESGLCCSDMYFMNVNDGSTYRNPPNWLSSPGYLTPAQLVEVIRKSKIPHPLSYTAVVRRSTLPTGPLYLDELKWYSDWFLLQVIALRHGCCYIPEPLALFRWLDRGYVHSGLNNRQDYKQVYTKIMQLLVAPEYEDIAPLIIRGRALQFIELHTRTPILTLKSILSARERNRYTNRLFLYLTFEYFREHLDTKNLSTLLNKTIVRPYRNATHWTTGKLKNFCDQIYAKLFHNYDRARSFFKKQEADQ